MKLKDRILNFMFGYGVLLFILIAGTVAPVVAIHYAKTHPQTSISDKSAMDKFTECAGSPTCEIVMPQTPRLSEREACLENANNMIQAWRCKQL